MKKCFFKVAFSKYIWRIKIQPDLFTNNTNRCGLAKAPVDPFPSSLESLQPRFLGDKTKIHAQLFTMLRIWWRVSSQIPQKIPLPHQDASPSSKHTSAESRVNTSVLLTAADDISCLTLSLQAASGSRRFLWIYYLYFYKHIEQWWANFSTGGPWCELKCDTRGGVFGDPLHSRKKYLGICKKKNQNTSF